MTPHQKRMIRGVLEALAVLIVLGIGVAFIASVLGGCMASTAPPGTMAGHNTTLPAQPACLLFCFAEVRSSIDTPIPAESRDKKGKQAQPPVVVPPPVINSAPPTTTIQPVMPRSLP
jgi:hypothetical protein